MISLLVLFFLSVDELPSTINTKIFPISPNDPMQQARITGVLWTLIDSVSKIALDEVERFGYKIVDAIAIDQLFLLICTSHSITDNNYVLLNIVDGLNYNVSISHFT